MAKETRNWGAGGRDNDGKAILPKKRVERLHGFTMRSTANVGAIQSLLTEAIDRQEKPTKVLYGGLSWNTKFYGIVSRGVFYSLDLIHDPEMEDGDVVLK